MNETFIESFKVTSEWKSGGDNYRLVDKGAGPKELQILTGDTWREESRCYIHSTLCNRIESLEKQHDQFTWQPLDSAPKDGTHILVGYNNLRECETNLVYEAIWNERQQLFTSLNGFIIHSDATHWMPLPLPPAKEH